MAEEETRFITAIQKGNDSPILPLTRESLEQMIADNPGAMKYLKRNRLQLALDTYNDN